MPTTHLRAAEEKNLEGNPQGMPLQFFPCPFSTLVAKVSSQEGMYTPAPRQVRARAHTHTARGGEGVLPPLKRQGKGKERGERRTSYLVRRVG